MKKLLAILLFLLPLVSFCQTETNTDSDWKVGVVFLQDFYRATDVSTDAYSGYFLEPADFNYTTGITGSYTLKSGLEVISGITYSKKDFIATYSCAVCLFIAMPQPENVEQRFLEVPVLLQYKVLDTKLGLNAVAGLLNGYKLSKAESEADKMMFGSRYLLSGQVGLGTSYTFNQKIALSLNAVYRRSLDDFARETDFELNSVGVGAGIAFILD